jgi:hypothetical protein
VTETADERRDRERAERQRRTDELAAQEAEIRRQREEAQRNPPDSK